MASDTLLVIRLFDAPRDHVWQAWTVPEQLQRWWGPQGFTCPVARIDLRVGGRYLNCMRAPDGQDYWSTGTYREIITGSRLVCTDAFADAKGNVVPTSHYGMAGNFAPEMLITVTMEDQDGRTRFTLEHEGLPAGEHLENCRLGWQQSLDKLADMVAEDHSCHAA